MNKDAYHDKLSKLRAKVVELEEVVSTLRKEKGCGIANFRLETIADDDFKVAFCTGFPLYAQLKVCFDFLSPAVPHLQYRDSAKVTDESKRNGCVLYRQ